jgi:pimeloyl-ACP methyl ester carboxylesterase
VFVVDMILLCRIDLNHDKEPKGIAQDGREEFIPDLEKHLIRECVHWTQAEKPEEAIFLISDWLIRRFR